jgi:hypothetical protein
VILLRFERHDAGRVVERGRCILAIAPEPAPDAPIDGSPNSEIYNPPANRDDEIAASDAPIRIFPKPVKLLITVFPST